MSKQSKASGMCVFCGRIGVTKQHMWPDWLKKVIPREGTEHMQHITRLDMVQRDLVVIRPELLFKRGPIGAKKIRKVCGPCNNGWMSTLEGVAKHTLTTMITGNHISLNREMQTAVAAWTIMTAIVAEYTDVPTQAIPPADRKLLMQGNLPNGSWRIWIGKYEGTEWKPQRYRHAGMSAVLNWGHWPLTRPLPNTQSSTFVMGSLLIIAMSSAAISPEKFPVPDGAHESLIQIWPPQNDTTEWPPSKVINDNEATSISNTLMCKFMPDNTPGHSSRWRRYGV